MLANNSEHIPSWDFRSARVDYDSELGEHSSYQSSDEGPTPEAHGSVVGGPLAGIVTQHDFKREVNQHDESHVVLTKALVQELETGDSVIGLETDLGNQVNDNDGLNVLQLQNAPHTLIHIHDAVAILGAVLLLHHGQTASDDQIRPAPEAEVGAEGQQAALTGNSSEPSVREIF